MKGFNHGYDDSVLFRSVSSPGRPEVLRWKRHPPRVSEELEIVMIVDGKSSENRNEAKELGNLSLVMKISSTNMWTTSIELSSRFFPSCYVLGINTKPLQIKRSIARQRGSDPLHPFRRTSTHITMHLNAIAIHGAQYLSQHDGLLCHKCV
ncbi:hypothetical protein SCHPADRAFT_498467 [Schizopora paradoxa]|uniref:Uncharacterized protein n=1 Tax=Schizopora paradoxa TaxID=27342 RepID=A0A0H2S1E8_9AGAM|nr:hypothetical protein SCHPADRAFT_498467 [Schizopora paradoxa]